MKPITPELQKRIEKARAEIQRRKKDNEWGGLCIYMQESVKALQAAAFEWGLNRIYIRNDTENPKSVHIPERLGYHLDGVMRQDCWDEFHQRFRNTNFWSLLKSEWEEKFKKDI